MGLSGIPVTGQCGVETAGTGSRNPSSFIVCRPPSRIYTRQKWRSTACLDQCPRSIEFFHTNRGGDITYHGPGQWVVYPILDLEKFERDIGKYLRSLEEVIIRLLADYGLKGARSVGETGVWLDPADPVRARKICAIGVRCSRWISMHGLALNVNTELSYFQHIVPCGIPDKQVTSLEKELGIRLPMEEVREKLLFHFAQEFHWSYH